MGGDFLAGPELCLFLVIGALYRIGRFGASSILIGPEKVLNLVIPAKETV
jgi:hypothetical protein